MVLYGTECCGKDPTGNNKVFNVCGADDGREVGTLILICNILDLQSRLSPIF